MTYESRWAGVVLNLWPLQRSLDSAKCPNPYRSERRSVLSKPTRHKSDCPCYPRYPFFFFLQNEEPYWNVWTPPRVFDEGGTGWQKTSFVSSIWRTRRELLLLGGDVPRIWTPGWTLADPRCTPRKSLSQLIFLRRCSSNPPLPPVYPPPPAAAAEACGGSLFQTFALCWRRLLILLCETSFPPRKSATVSGKYDLEGNFKSFPDVFFFFASVVFWMWSFCVHVHLNLTWWTWQTNADLFVLMISRNTRIHLLLCYTAVVKSSVSGLAFPKSAMRGRIGAAEDLSRDPEESGGNYTVIAPRLP